MKRVVVVGGGGHARVVVDAIESAGCAKILGYVTDGTAVVGGSYPKLGCDEDLPTLASTLGPFHLAIAIGDGRIRKRIVQMIATRLAQFDYLTVVHQKANLAGRVKLGRGSFVAIGASLGVGAVIGEHALINTNASVDHDCIVSAYASIGPNVALGGGVQVGEEVLVGIGATVLPGITIGDRATVAAGAVVTRDIAPGSLVMGIPARVVSKVTQQSLRPY